MKSLRTLALIALVLATVAGPAAAAPGPFFQTDNEIGLYLSPQPTGCLDVALFYWTPQPITLYAVLTRPYNYDTAGSIDHVGGFEFRVVTPPNMVMVSSTLPPQSLNFMTPPDFYVGCNLPVANGMCTLMEMQFQPLQPVEPVAETAFYLEPVFQHPSIPGSLAITDADDAFSLQPAFPSSGDMSLPVWVGFGGLPLQAMGGSIQQCVVPNEATSFGALKALYR